MGFRLWKIPEQTPEQIERLARDSGLSWALSAVLLSRGIRTAGEAAAFLNGSGELETPFSLKDMDKAAERIRSAIEDGERIAVYGDYDCDGVTATALLTSYLQSVGADVIYYVPSREKEGYGLNRAAIDLLYGQRTDLIVTVDNGVSAHDEVDYANSLGMNVVITDHHTTRPTLPDAVAVVNPRRSDCPSAFKELAGVGVAFKLVCAIENAPPAELLEYYSDLVALGTIGDVVSLTGENRAIVKHGLTRLSDSGRPGIEALLNTGGLCGKELSSEAVAFGLVPRVNAAGRMGCADDAIELLLTDDADCAEEMAQLIESQNSKRKQAEEQIIKEISGIIRQNPDILLERVIIMSGPGWHHGVVGIVASKLVEKYGKPCILISDDGDIARGSGRSIEGFSLIEAITACSSCLTQFGGHAMAAGLTIPTASIGAFRHDIQAFASESYPTMPPDLCRVDCALPAERVTLGEIEALSVLEPFGARNEAPLFLLEGFTIDGIYPTADGKHIRLRLLKGECQVYAVYFGMTAQSFPYRPGDAVDVVAGVSAGEYNGKSRLSIKIRDLRISGAQQKLIFEDSEAYSRHLRGEYSNKDDLGRLLIGREDMAVVYKFLRKHGGYGYGELPLYYRLMGSGVGFCQMLVSLDIMEELGLLTRTDGNISPVPDPPRVNMEHSGILSALKAEMRVMQGG